MIQVWNHFHSYDKSTLSPNFRPLPRTNRKHPFQLTWNRPKDGARGRQQNSFYFRVSNKWNLLPHEVVGAESVDTFKSRLDAAWTNHETKFTIELPSATEDQERFLGAFQFVNLKYMIIIIILFKSFGRDKFGPIKEQYPSLQCQSDDVIMTSSSHWQQTIYF